MLFANAPFWSLRVSTIMASNETFIAARFLCGGVAVRGSFDVSKVIMLNDCARPGHMPKQSSAQSGDAEKGGPQ